ncbi:MAG: hypothetical protein OK456_03565 [Thaumarchaeota archaeon]|nr:hypothetical protein [Nitrososphaerota archaeon]
MKLAEGAKQVFLMSWLWSIFGGFYLVAYVFWVPQLFVSLALVIVVAAVTLVVGAGLLQDGFLKAVELQTGSRIRPLALRRVRRFLGGVLLLGYLTVYIPPQGRIVAHWPLDLAITAVSGVIMVVYGILNL